MARAMRLAVEAGRVARASGRIPKRPLAFASSGGRRADRLASVGGRSVSLPALVEPAPPLRPDRAARFARHLALPGVGEIGQRRIAAARVLVIGAGGLGAPVIQYLAAAGVGRITVVDDDRVERTNLQRQVLHTEADVGRPKAESASDAVARLDADVDVLALVSRLDADNALALFRDHDLVLDGSDNFATRYLVNDAAELTGTPVVWGSIHRFAGQVSVFWPGRGPMLRDLFPEIPDADSIETCAVGGVLGALCGAIGSVMATEALKLLCGIGEPLLGRLSRYDALSGRWDELRFGADPDRRPVVDLEEVAIACRAASPSARLDDISAGEVVARLAERERRALRARRAHCRRAGIGGDTGVGAPAARQHPRRRVAGGRRGARRECRRRARHRRDRPGRASHRRGRSTRSPQPLPRRAPAGAIWPARWDAFAGSGFAAGQVRSGNGALRLLEAPRGPRLGQPAATGAGESKSSRSRKPAHGTECDDDGTDQHHERRSEQHGAAAADKGGEHPGGQRSDRNHAPGHEPHRRHDPREQLGRAGDLAIGARHDASPARRMRRRRSCRRQSRSTRRSPTLRGSGVLPQSRQARRTAVLSRSRTAVPTTGWPPRRAASQTPVGCEEHADRGRWCVEVAHQVEGEQRGLNAGRRG